MVKNNDINENNGKEEKKQKIYNRQFKYISVRLFRDISIVTDVVFVQYNVDSDTIHIHDILTFDRQRMVSIKICEKLLRKVKIPVNNDIKSRIRELVKNEPMISAKQIRDLTGYNWHIVCRYYMGIKKELCKKSKNNVESNNR